MAHDIPAATTAKPLASGIRSTLETRRSLVARRATVVAVGGDIALAVLIQQLHFREHSDRCCEKFEDADGLGWWVDASRAEIAEDLGISEQQARRLIEKARTLGVIETSQPFAGSHDRRLFARFLPDREADIDRGVGAESTEGLGAESTPLPLEGVRDKDLETPPASPRVSTPGSAGREPLPQGARSVERAEPDVAREIVDLVWRRRKVEGKPLPTVRSGSPFMALVALTRKLLEAGHDRELVALTLYDHDSAWTNDSVLVTLSKVQRGKATDPRLAAAMRDKRVEDEMRRIREERG